MRALPEALVPARPRVSPQLARRIDRLARYAHRWHRHAHHPLCGAYAGELVQLGRRTRVCRGCACALTGALLGASAGFASWPLAFAGVPWLGALTAVPAAAAMALLHARWKLLTRAAPAFVLACVFALGLRRGDMAGVVLALSAAGATAGAWLAYRRRGPNRSGCAGCPEGPPHAGCSGFLRIVRSERAFQRLAGRWLRAAERTIW